MAFEKVLKNRFFIKPIQLNCSSKTLVVEKWPKNLEHFAMVECILSRLGSIYFQEFSFHPGRPEEQRKVWHLEQNYSSKCGGGRQDTYFQVAFLFSFVSFSHVCSFLVHIILHWLTERTNKTIKLPYFQIKQNNKNLKKILMCCLFVCFLCR